MSSDKEPRLQFMPAGGALEGFVSGALAGFGSVDPDTVIRELTQNALDAAKAAKQPITKVEMHLEDVDVQDIPGLADYKEHFEIACDTQKKAGNINPPAQTVINAINESLESNKLQTLWVLDNGIGLNTDRMNGLLSDGGGGKGGDGQAAGFFGVGHLAAFPASNLRYLLYGGVFDSGELNAVSRIVAGHTILATHQREKIAGGGGE